MHLQLRYAVPLFALSALTGLFFLPRRRSLSPRITRVLCTVAALPLVVSGIVHLARPAVFIPLLPPPLPQASWFIVVTGLPELLGAAGLLLPRTRRAAALALAAYMVVIFPANVHVAGQTIGGLRMPAVPTRTAMQAAYILLLLVAGWGLPSRPVSRSGSPAS